MILSELMLELETLLVDELGTQLNGAPAIYSEPPIADTSGVQGLACIVQKSPDTNKVLASSRGQKYIDETMTVTLIQFDQNKTLTNAIYLILQKYPVYDLTTKIQDEEYYEMCVIKLWNRGFI